MTKGVGGSAELGVVRKGQPVKATITLVAPIEDPPRDARDLTGRHPLAGCKVANLSPAVAQEVGMEDDTREGVVVLEVSGPLRAARFGVRRGDIVVGSTMRRSHRSSSWPASRRFHAAPGGFGRARGKDVQSRHSGLSMKKAAVTLFEAAGLADSAPRPLADRLRPAPLAEVIGQDHLLASRACCPRMVKAGRLFGDLLGTAGHRQDHRGRLLAETTDLPFRAALGDPARGLGCARCSTPRRRGARRDAAHCSSSTRSTASTAAAGRFPAAYGRRHHHSGRRHHREPVFRAEFGAAVAGERAHLQRLDDAAIEALLDRAEAHAGPQVAADPRRRARR